LERKTPAVLGDGAWLDECQGSKCGFGNQPSGQTTTTTNTTPWVQQQPYLEQAMSGAQTLYNNYVPQYYPGGTYSPQTGAQTQALNDVYGLASNPSPVTAPATNFSSSLLSGDYLNNPGSMFEMPIASGAATANLPGSQTLNAYASGLPENTQTNALVNSIESQVEPGIMSQFVQGNDLNNPAAAYSVAQGVTSALAPSLFSNFQAQEGL